MINFMLNNFNIISKFSIRWHKVVLAKIIEFSIIFKSLYVFFDRYNNELINYKGQAYLDDILYELNLNNF